MPEQKFQLFSISLRSLLSAQKKDFQRMKSSLEISKSDSRYLWNQISQENVLLSILKSFSN